MPPRFVRLTGPARDLFARWLRDDYETGASVAALGHRYGVSYGGVQSLLALTGTPMRPAHGHPRSRGPHRDRLAADARRRYENGTPARMLARRYGVTRTTAQALIREAGGTLTRRRKLTDEQAASAALAYLDGVHVDRLTAEYGVCHTTLYEALDTMHIPRRRKARDRRHDEHQDHDDGRALVCR